MYRILGFDIGITSIGWALVENNELKDCGVRIFTKAENPKNGDSLAAPRREARSTRRRLARRKARLDALKRLLCKEFGLNLDDYLSNDGELPKAYETQKGAKSPYELRAEALERKLGADEFARVILHIAKHRGYGNKHAKDSSDNESGKVKKAIKENEQILLEKGYQSAGQYLYKEFFEKPRDFAIEQKSPKNTQNTQEFKNVRNKTESYTRCLSQGELQKELELIFAKQREFGFNFSNTAYTINDENGKIKELNFESAILKVAFLQRPLKSFEDKVGKCTFFADKLRAPKDCLSAMEFVALTRIINALANITKRSGEVYHINKVREILDTVLEKGEISYKNLRTMINLDEKIQFPKDSKLDYSKDDAEKAKFIEFKKLKDFKKAFGGSFEEFNRGELDNIVKDIALHKSKAELKNKLAHYQSLNETQRENLSELNFDQFIDLSVEALEKILPFMRGEIDDKNYLYDEAVKAAGLQEHRKHKQKGEFLIPLKEYEPYLANPVVARALSEYRKVLNALLKKYGKVHKIHLEFTREAKLSAKERQKYEKEQREHFEANQKAKELCKQIGIDENNTNNILKAKLFIEQGEFCVYSGKKITINDLSESICIYSGQKITKKHLLDSNALQIDHIYPYSRSFDDSYMNKVLVFAKENQNKLNKTPFEAFSKDDTKWASIKALASKLPKPKQYRILNKNFNEKESGFIARNINDTGYIARLASAWTKHSLEFLPLSENEVSIAGEKGSKVHIEVISGHLTSTLRHYWGLGSKNRDNHLHHALDAVIIAYADAKIIKAFAEFKKQQEQNKAKFYAKQIAEQEYKKQKAFFEPCAQFRDKILEKVDCLFVSKPPRKRARGALHKETFYPFEKLCNDKEYSKKEKMDYGGKQGIEKAISLGKIRQVGTKIVNNGAMVRVDIFKDKKGKFYGVPIYTMDFALGILPNKAVVQGKDNGIIKDWIEMDSSYEFCFSLFKDDLILVQKKEMEKAELCYYTEFKSSTAGINFEKHNNLYVNLSKNESKLFTSKEPVKGGKKKEWKDKTPEEIEQLEKNRKIIGGFVTIEDLKVFEKYQVSPLGEVQKADFIPRQNIALKSSPKRDKNEL